MFTYRKIMTVKSSRRAIPIAGRARKVFDQFYDCATQKCPY